MNKKEMEKFFVNTHLWANIIFYGGVGMVVLSIVLVVALKKGWIKN